MITLLDICYVRLGTADLDSAVRYATTILGLEIATRESQIVYLRADERDHTLVYVAGDPRDQTVGFELRDHSELAAAAVTLENAGHVVRLGSAGECNERRVNGFINCRDPSGNSIDLVVGPAHSGRRYSGSRDAGITRFSHVGLCSTAPRRDEVFWTELCNARVSDRIGEAPLLRIDQVHHKIALFPARACGVQHVNHQVESIDDIMRSHYFLQDKGVKIRFGPGRHPTSGAVFLYFEGPDGMTFEYSSGVRLIEDEASHVSRQFPSTFASFCAWGSKPDIPEFRS